MPSLNHSSRQAGEPCQRAPRIRCESWWWRGRHAPSSQVRGGRPCDWRIRFREPSAGFDSRPATFVELASIEVDRIASVRNGQYVPRSEQSGQGIFWSLQMTIRRRFDRRIRVLAVVNYASAGVALVGMVLALVIGLPYLAISVCAIVVQSINWTAVYLFALRCPRCEMNVLNDRDVLRFPWHTKRVLASSSGCRVCGLDFDQPGLDA